MRSSGFMLITSVMALILVPVVVFANGLYGPSVGVRSSAMGGAFIGLADDYSAVFWNPAGITQIKGMELTVTAQDVVSLASRDGFVIFDGDGTGPADRFAIAEVAATSRAQNLIAPGIFFYTDPGPLRGIIDKVGLAAYTLTEYGTKWSGNEVYEYDGFVRHEYNYDGFMFPALLHDYESSVKNYVISPIVAKEIMPGLSVGLTANLTYSHMTLKDMIIYNEAMAIDIPGAVDPWLLLLVPLRMADDVTAWGYGATLGALYRVNSQISVGATARSPMTMAYEGTYEMSWTAGSAGGETFKFPLDFEMRYPTWAGAGMAYRDFVFDGLTFTADLQWTDWSTFEEIQRNMEPSGEYLASDLYEGTGFELSSRERTDLNWEDTFAIGLGFDYRLNRSVSLNLGYRSDPSPVADPEETYNFLIPQTAKNTITVGATYREDFWRASFALEYQASETITLYDADTMNGDHLEDRLVPMLSLTYAF